MRSSLMALHPKALQNPQSPVPQEIKNFWPDLSGYQRQFRPSNLNINFTDCNNKIEIYFQNGMLYIIKYHVKFYNRIILQQRSWLW